MFEFLPKQTKHIKPNQSYYQTQCYQSIPSKATKLYSRTIYAKFKPCKSIKISKDKAWQVKACPELGTAQPWIVYSFSYLTFPKPIAQAAKCKGYDPLGKEKARDCRDKEQDSHDEHLQDLRRVEHQDHMVSISLVLQCFYRIRTRQIKTMRWRTNYYHIDFSVGIVVGVCFCK